MIISHKHRYIFIHCRKTAGSAVSAFLAEHHGPNDIQIGAWPETWARGIRPNRRFLQDLCGMRAGHGFAQQMHLMVNRKKRLSMAECFNEAQKRRYRPHFGLNAAHPPAVAVSAFDPDAWRNYFKFCFVRNPYERLVSDYLWRQRVTDDRTISFAGFVNRIAEGRYGGLVSERFDNWPMYTIEDEIAVDEVYRYENLRPDLASACRRIGIDSSLDSLGQAKRAQAPYNYRDFYDSVTRNQVARLFAREIKAFGYVF